MTKEKIVAVLDLYKDKLAEDYGILVGVRLDHDIKAMHHFSAYTLWGHVASMINQVKFFLDEDRLEKAFRWLGFIQGVLWATGVYSIEELKNHNRPD